MFNSVFEKLNKISLAHRPIIVRSGLYHYTYDELGERSRIHLRVDPDGSGILLVNANRVFQLNPTAAAMAFLTLEKTSEIQAVKAIRQAYHVSISQAQSDYTQFVNGFWGLIRPDGACPICQIEQDQTGFLTMTAPFSAHPFAPYRMDLAITYRCNNDCAHCYNSRPRDYPEISTRQWKTILNRLWDTGIPHIVFTGGEPSLRADLAELIAHAEKNGQITGLNTNARRLMDYDFLQKLIDAGLDHVQITLESHDPEIHDKMVCCHGAWKQTITGLRNALNSPLYVMTNTTMLVENSPFLSETLDFLAAEGVPTIGLNALIYSGRGRTVGSGLTESALMPLLEIAQEKTSSHGQRLIWYTPTKYCNFDPMQLELGVKGCTAALYNMCVEPDGGVIPCQSYYQQIGSMLKDPWKAIWNHKLAVSLRERSAIPEKCRDCSLLSECGGGCPLAEGNLGISGGDALEA
jgi:radical SAM protein with 4Fe4S-binding SPASM domain